MTTAPGIRGPFVLLKGAALSSNVVERCHLDYAGPRQYRGIP